MSKVISRQSARVAGLKRYFTGRPCKYGHVSERYVSIGTCCECQHGRTFIWDKQNSNKKNASRRQRYSNNPSKYLEEVRLWQSNNPDSVRATARRKNLKQYNLTEKQYEAMLQSQGGGCACCGRPGSGTRNLCVDHNHKTGEVRGLLCDGCNAGVGYIEHELRPIWEAYLTERK